MCVGVRVGGRVGIWVGIAFAVACIMDSAISRAFSSSKASSACFFTILACTVASISGVAVGLVSAVSSHAIALNSKRPIPIKLRLPLITTRSPCGCKDGQGYFFSKNSEKPSAIGGGARFSETAIYSFACMSRQGVPTLSIINRLIP